MKRRIFIAIDINDEARRRVSEHINFLRSEFPNVNAGWEKPEKLHLTLKFLGETDENQLNRLIETIENAANQVSKFRLRVSGTLAFGWRVLFIGINDESANLLKLYEFLEAECEKIGFEKETRKFKPHLTVARTHKVKDKNQLFIKHFQTKFEPVEFEVSEIVIYESKLQPKGSIYNIISKYKLNK